jgi:phosphoribosyl 1,2-cyclic phosphodiesterase
MIVAPLGSGSAGNSFWFESDGTSILVDAGFGPRETKRRLEEVGGDIEKLAGIVITHEHYDHIRGAEAIARKFHVPIYLTQGTLNSSRIDQTETRVIVFQNNSTIEIGELAVHAQRTIHDATDPACFVIESRDGTRVGIASDLGYIDAPVIGHLRNCDGLFFESNHDLDMLRLGSYPWSLKRRIMSRFGHLSNDDSIVALQRMLCAETKTLCLIHLSQKNNDESIVRDMTTKMIDRMGAQLELAIAKQEMPTKRFDIRRRSVQRAVTTSMQFSLF